MNLREYLRAEWGQYIRPLIIKDKCEFCGSEEDLHLHHIDKFYNLLMETLEELQLQELDTEDYTKEELNLISHLMLSKQIRSRYKTLCKDCHFKIHNIEKFEEEYKRHYYNPNGSYIILDIDKLKELKIDNNILPRYIYLCCYSNYGNKLTIVTSKTRHKTILKDDLFNIFTMGRMEVYRTLKELTDNGLIQIEDETIFLNKTYCTKGSSNYKNKLKIFTEGYINIFNTLEPRQHKTLGNIINNSICDNLIYDNYNSEKYGNITRLGQYINSIDNLGKFDKKIITLNPNIFYGGYLDNSYKKILEEYESI